MIDATLALGAAVVKATCKIWLKDEHFANDLSITVIDIVNSRIADSRQKRKINRLFENMEENVADHIVRGLEIEFRDVPENERTAAVLAAARVFNESRLTNSDLFSSDLDPSLLERHLRRQRTDTTKDLSSGAIELYGRILGGCCSYVVQVANLLPGFEVGVFSTILRREVEISKQVEDVLRNLPIRLDNEAAEAFDVRYRQLIARRLDSVELFGVTVNENLRGYPLTTSYVSLKAAPSDIQSRFPARLFDNVSESDGSFSDAPESISIEEAIALDRRIFIRGEAGSGKTTLLQWLAVRSCRGDFDKHLTKWNDSVPFLIKLRQYAGHDLPQPADFISGVARPIESEMPKGWVNGLLRNGRALILIDGVDELPDEERASARKWLRDLVGAYPEARYVVTSRPTAASNAWLSTDGFTPLEIQPMGMADIEAFVTHWHTAFRVVATEYDEKERLNKYETKLIETIRSTRYLRSLATSPLLVALLCALNLDRRMHLPRDRSELYSIALEMLLERRDIERNIVSNHPSIGRSDKLLLLEDVAYWLIKNGWSDAPVDRILTRLAGKLVNMHRVQASADSVLKVLLDRSGLLRSPIEGRIDFVHRTFEEYLAARAAIDSDEVGLLVANAANDQWREVVLMAVAHANLRQREELILGLLARADENPEQSHVLHALAVGCLQNSPELPSDLRKKLQKVAVDLLPPKGFAEAEALANAGDLVLDLMSLQLPSKIREITATIRMASIIGGEQALSLIGRFAPRGGNVNVRTEIRRAWQRFDPEVYAQNVLRKTPHSQSIEIEDPNLIPGLKHLELRHLRCYFPHGFGKIDFIADSPSLDHLAVHDPQLGDIRVVADHPELSGLEIMDSMMLDIKPIVQASNIRRLDIDFRRISNPESLAMLGDMENLQFAGTASVADACQHLPSGTKIKRLGFWHANSLWDFDTIRSLSQCVSLEFLLLGDCGQMSSLAGIEDCAARMTGIYLAAPNLPDVDRIGALRSLEFVNISRTPVTNLNFFAGMENLRILHIGGVTKIPDLSPLQDCPSLRTLFIWGKDKVDLSGLRGIRNLKVQITNMHKRPIIGRDLLGEGSSVSRRLAR